MLEIITLYFGTHIRICHTTLLLIEWIFATYSNVFKKKKWVWGGGGLFVEKYKKSHFMCFCVLCYFQDLLNKFCCGGGGGGGEGGGVFVKTNFISCLLSILSYFQHF